ncbi:DUF4352 domain-containing protein [Janibacter sp. GXQ6167]|uniref:DUF4352 domain-containing protein n=1 Tax=Janibacter sp. GXQ6167 TaxID=3240791 RepID=UPI003524061C
MTQPPPQYPPDPQWQQRAQYPQPPQQWQAPGYPPPKKNWFAANPVLAVLLGAVLIIFMCCAGGIGLGMGASDSATTDQVASDESDATSTTTSSAKKAASATKTADKTAAKKTQAAKPKAAGPALGDTVRDGKFEFVVTEVKSGVDSVGGTYLNEQAQGQFVLISISVTNVGDESQTLYDGAQKLTDDKGRTFESNSYAAIVMEDNDVWMTKINPGNTVTGTLVYDMPKGAKPVTIDLHDSMFSGGVEVSLRK